MRNQQPTDPTAGIDAVDEPDDQPEPGVRQRERDARWVHHLAEGLSIAATARETRVSERTVRRRLADPVFAAEVDAATRERSREVASRLVSAGERSIAVLVELLDADPVGVRLAAAKTLLDHGNRIAFRRLEAAELESRLRTLEVAANGNDDDDDTSWDLADHGGDR
jgi:AraC-like DNA-binding protein